LDKSKNVENISYMKSYPKKPQLLSKNVSFSKYIPNFMSKSNSFASPSNFPSYIEKEKLLINETSDNVTITLRLNRCQILKK